VITHQIDIVMRRPVETVYRFLTDAANHPRWDSSSLVMEPLEPGPWREGLTFREVRRIGPRNVEIRSSVAALTPNERFDIRNLTGPPFQGHWRCTPEGARGCAGPARRD
jgi:hypothetical protein